MLVSLALLLSGCLDTRKSVDFASDPSVLRGTWQAEVGKVTGESVAGLAFNPDSSSFAAATSYGFDLYDTQTFTSTKIDLGPGQVSFSADGTRLGVSGPAVQIVDLATGKTLLDFDVVEQDGLSATSVLSPNFDLFATALYYRDENTVKVWSAKTGDLLYTLEHPAAVGELIFSPDGSYLLVGGSTSTYFVWDLKTGQLVRQFTSVKYNGSSLYRTLFTPDGRQLWVQWLGRLIDRWDFASGAYLDTPAEFKASYLLGFSGDGTAVLTASLFAPPYDTNATQLELLDIATGERRAGVRAPSAPFALYTPPVLSRDERYVVAATTDGVVQMFELETGQLLQTLPDPAPETLTLDLEATFLDEWHYGVSGTVTDASGTVRDLQGEVQGGSEQKYLAPADYYAPVSFRAKTTAEDGQASTWVIDALLPNRNDEVYTGFIEDGTLGTSERGLRRELKLERVSANQ